MKRLRLAFWTALFRRTRSRARRERILPRLERLDDPARTACRALWKELFGVEIGRYSYRCLVLEERFAPGTRIGRFCSIAHGVTLGGMRHPADRVSTHPFTYHDNRGFVAETDEEVFRAGNPPIVIEDDVHIGRDAVVLAGVTVGKGAIVGANAVVTKDVAPYTFVAGVPAQVIRRRFDDDLVERLLAIDWASWPDEVIRERIDDFRDPRRFVERWGDPA